MHDCVTMLYSRSWYNIEEQLYSNKNKKKIKTHKISVCLKYQKKKKKAKTKPKTLKSCQMSKLRNKKDYLSLVVGRGKWPLICP